MDFGFNKSDPIEDIEEYWYEHREIRITLMAIEILLCSFIVLTNSLVLLLFYLERKWQKVSHKYSISLALSDLLQGLVNPGIHMYLVNGAKVESPHCTYVLTVGIMVLLISLFTIFTVSADRFWAICYPVCYKTNATDCAALAIIYGGWITGFTLGILLLVFEKTPNEPQLLCLVFTERFETYYSLAVCFLAVIPTLLVVVYFYYRIYHVIMDSMDTKVFDERMDKLRRIVLRVDESASSTPTTPGPAPLDSSRRDHNREIRTTVVIFVTVLLYAICWIPGIILLFQLIIDPHSVSVTGILLVYILNHINSAIDPFLYAYNLKGARGAVRRLIRRTTWIKNGTSQANGNQ